MKIAIKFGDRDFHRTFYSVLRAFLAAWRDSPEDVERLDATDIMLIVNTSALGHFLLTGSRYSPREDDPKDWTLAGYLQIDESQVLRNEEVDALLASDEYFRNGECFILDTELDWPGNSPVYEI